MPARSVRVTGIVFSRVHAKRSLFYKETRHLQDVQAITELAAARELTRGTDYVLARGNHAYFFRAFH